MIVATDSNDDVINILPKRGYEKYYFDRPLDPNPTQELPGSKNKIKVMADRYTNGYALWHPMDAGMCDLATMMSREDTPINLLQRMACNGKGREWDKEDRESWWWGTGDDEPYE